MQAVVQMDVRPCKEGFKRATRRVFTVCEAIGDVRVPMRKAGIQGAQPFTYTSLTGVDLLTSSREAHNCRPVRMPVEVGDEETGLRIAEVRLIFPPAHELDGLLLVPRPLRFVEDYDSVGWWPIVLKPFITEVMNVLDERLNGVSAS